VFWALGVHEHVRVGIEGHRLASVSKLSRQVGDGNALLDLERRMELPARHDGLTRSPR
jgi:hypothetical protein